MEVNAEVVVESALYLHKKEEQAIEVGTDQKQESTYLREIQYQRDINSYSGTLSDLYATGMDTLPTNAQINNQNQSIL